MGDQVVVDMQVVGEAVHEDEGRRIPRIVAGVDIARWALNPVFLERRCARVRMG